MRKHVSVLQAAVVALALTGAGTGCGRDAGGSGTSRSGRRSIVAERWDTAFVVESNAQDSTLLMPFHPTAGTGGVYLADFYGNRILHFDSLGHRVWSFGAKGGGPGEFRRIRDLKVDALGRVWVLDQRNLRLTVLGPGGSPQRLIPLTELPAMPDGVVPLRDGGAIIIQDDPRAALIQISPEGHVIGELAIPWPQFRTLNSMAAQLASASDPHSDRWVAAFQTGDGFFSFSRATALPGRLPYIEAVNFPEIEVVRTGNTVETRFRNPPVIAAQSISLSPTRLYVLFGGASRHARRVVDSYSLRDGRYTGSYLLPHVADGLAWGDGGFYVTYTSPYPHLALWRPRGARIP